MSFGSLKYYLFLVGIERNNRHGKYFDIISICFIYGSTVIYFISTFWYFAFTAKNLYEYTDAFYYMSSSLLMFGWYSIYLMKRTEYIELFKELDSMIERSIWIFFITIPFHSE